MFFEVLAQISLFQMTLQSYDELKPSSTFRSWFDQIDIFSEAEGFDRFGDLFFFVVETIFLKKFQRWKRSQQIEPDEFLPQTNEKENPSVKQQSKTDDSHLNVQVFFPGRDEGKSRSFRVRFERNFLFR